MAHKIYFYIFKIYLIVWRKSTGERDRMTYVDNASVEICVKEIIDTVIEPFTGVLNIGNYKVTEENLKSLIGRFLGLRTEDGKQRVYDVQLIEGEPYVMDE